MINRREFGLTAVIGGLGLAHKEDEKEQVVEKHIWPRTSSEIQAILSQIKKSTKIAKVEWDFCTSLGDTIKEKYESLFFSVVDWTRSIDNILSPPINRFWLYGSPEITSIFEVIVSGFHPSSSDIYDQGNLSYCGMVTGWLDYKWDLFKDSSLLQKNIFRIGSQDKYFEVEIMNVLDLKYLHTLKIH